jgi:hypothetical protein
MLILSLKLVIFVMLHVLHVLALSVVHQLALESARQDFMELILALPAFLDVLHVLVVYLPIAILVLMVIFCIQESV